MSGISGILSSQQIATLIKDAETRMDAPISLIQAQEQGVKTELSAVGQVQSAMSSLQSALSKLSDLSSLSRVTASVSSSGAVTATASNDTPQGTYQLSNIVLAHSESLVSSGYSSESASLGSGSLTFQVGSGTAQTVSIPTGEDTLSGVADAINAASVGVQASVMFNGTGYQLVLAGNNTGTSNGFTVSGSGGMSAFTYESGNHLMNETQAATNASFSLNGVAITSGSDTVTGAVSGLSIGLKSSGSATVTVSQDPSALVDNAQSVVTALNHALSTIESLDSYSSASSSGAGNASGTQGSGGKAGPLLGNVGVEILKSELLGAITQPAVGASPGSQFYSLASVGFSVSGGKVELNSSELTSAAKTDYGAVASLLGAFGNSTDSNVSVANLGSATPGVYDVNVTSNGASGLVGTVNGEAASGSGALLTVTGPGAAEGLQLNIAAGVTGALGTVSVSDGLYGQLNAVLNSALDPQTGSLTQETSGLQNELDSMDKQIAQMKKSVQDRVSALTNEYAQTQATFNQLSTVGNFLSTFSQATSG